MQQSGNPGATFIYFSLAQLSEKKKKISTFGKKN